MINNFKSGIGNMNQQQIEQNVQQAMQFYSNVDANLTRYENL